MLLPGRLVAANGILKGIRSAESQVQPCGIDLSLRRVLRWKNAGVIDFDNKRRKAADTAEMPFEEDGSIHLQQGAYLAEFNETVDTPLDAAGQIFVRSSLFRSGASITAGVMDSGYRGAVGAMLQVLNPHGLLLYRDAKLAQIVFHLLSEKVEGYSGIYQGSERV